MRAIDREGIFRAVPLSWTIKESQSSSSVAVSIQLQILAQLEGGAWTDWSEYEPHQVWGDFWIVKKDGTVNQTQVEALAAALGWNGNLTAIGGSPPSIEVQVSVKADEYQGVTRFKAAWINPGDFQPGPDRPDASKLNELQSRFGSLLRAAAGGAAKAAPKQAPKPAPAKVPPPRRQDDPPLTVDETPF